LRSLDLPNPACLLAATRLYADPEKAALAAYEASARLAANRNVA
jgi:hypothetical protein